MSTNTNKIKCHCDECHRTIEIHEGHLPSLQSLAIDCEYEPGGPEGCTGTFFEDEDDEYDRTHPKRAVHNLLHVEGNRFPETCYWCS